MCFISLLFLRVRLRSDERFNYSENLIKQLFYNGSNLQIAEDLQDYELFLSQQYINDNQNNMLCKVESDPVLIYEYHYPERTQNTVFINPGTKGINMIYDNYIYKNYKFVTNKDEASIIVTNFKIKYDSHQTKIYEKYINMYVYGDEAVKPYLKCSNGIKFSTFFHKLSIILPILYVVIMISRVLILMTKKRWKISDVTENICSNTQFSSTNGVDSYFVETLEIKYLKDKGIELKVPRTSFDTNIPQPIDFGPQSNRVCGFMNPFTKTELQFPFELNGEKSKVIISQIEQFQIIERYLPLSIEKTIFELILSSHFLIPKKEFFEEFFIALCNTMHFKQMQLFSITNDGGKEKIEEIKHTSQPNTHIPLLDIETIRKLIQDQKQLCKIITQNNNKYVLSSMVIGRDTFVLVSCTPNSELADFNNYYTRLAAILISMWAKRLLSCSRERTFGSYQKLLIEDHGLFLLEYDCARQMEIISYGNLNMLKQNKEFTEKYNNLLKDGTPINRELFKVFDSNDKKEKWLSVSGRRSYDESRESDIALVLAEDITQILESQQSIKGEIEVMERTARLIGLHLVSLPSLELRSDRLGDELGYSHVQNLREIVPEETIRQIESMEVGQQITIDLSTKEGAKLFYTAVKPSSKRALLFSVDEAIRMTTVLKSASDFMTIGRSTRNWSLWSLSLDDAGPAKESFLRTIRHDELLELVDPRDRHRLAKARLLALKEPTTFEITMRLLPTEPFEFFQMSLQPRGDNEVIVFAFNISTIKKANEMLAEAEELLSLALTYSRVHMWRWDDSGGSVLTSDLQVGESVGFGPDTVSHNIPLEHQKEFLDAVERTRGREGATIDVEVPFILERLHWLLVRGTAIEDELVGVYIDITELKETANKMRRQKQIAEDALRAKSRFLANLTHEVRNPTYEIVKILELLASTELNAEQHELVTCMQSSVYDLLELLDDTWELTRLESNFAVPNFVTFNVFEQMYESEKHMYEVARKKGLAFKMNTDPTHPVKYIGDPRYLTRILNALLSNAVKFTEKGSYSMKTTPMDGGFQLVVSDTGVGIPPEQVAAIRRHFEEGPLIAVRETGGAGVGLSVVSAMLRNIGGKLEISSTIGKGTTVKAWFPFEPALLMTPPRKIYNRVALFISAQGNQWGLTVRFLDFYQISHIVMSVKDVIEKRPHFDVVMIDDKRPGVLDEVVELQKAGFLGNDVHLCVLTDNEWPDLPVNQTIFQKPLEIMKLHTFLSNISRGIKREDVVIRESEKAQLLQGTRVLMLEDASALQFAGARILDRIGCQFNTQPLDQPIGDVSECDVILEWIEQSGRIDSAIENIRKFRETDSSTPIVCVTLASQPEDGDRCLHAGCSTIVTSPVTIPGLSAALIRYHRKADK